MNDDSMIGRGAHENAAMEGMKIDVEKAKVLAMLVAAAHEAQIES